MQEERRTFEISQVFLWLTQELCVCVFALTVSDIDYALKTLHACLNTRRILTLVNLNRSVLPSSSWITQPLFSCLIQPQKSCWHMLYANCPLLLLHFYHHFERKRSGAACTKCDHYKTAIVSNGTTNLLFLLGHWNHVILHLIGLCESACVRAACSCLPSSVAVCCECLMEDGKLSKNPILKKGHLKIER